MCSSLQSYLFNPLMPLRANHSRESPLLCIPGAGASVTSFIEFIDALGDRWPIYGLQPRGIVFTEQPDYSVETAALHNLKALEQLHAQPIHLMGHSHGGLIAFDMALRLHEQGRPVASLTLIDTEPPEVTVRTLSDTEIRRQFVETFEDTFDISLNVNEARIRSAQAELFISDLHGALIRAKCLPARSTPDMLRGPFATFAAALRTTYTPAKHYAGKVHLALVNNKRINKDDDLKQREAHIAAWRREAPQLTVWHGPGHHFSILQSPHVHLLAKWWRKARES